MATPRQYTNVVRPLTAEQLWTAQVLSDEGVVEAELDDGTVRLHQMTADMLATDLSRRHDPPEKNQIYEAAIRPSHNLPSDIVYTPELRQIERWAGSFRKDDESEIVRAAMGLAEAIYEKRAKSCQSDIRRLNRFLARHDSQFYVSFGPSRARTFPIARLEALKLSAPDGDGRTLAVPVFAGRQAARGLQPAIYGGIRQVLLETAGPES